MRVQLKELSTQHYRHIALEELLGNLLVVKLFLFLALQELETLDCFLRKILFVHTKSEQEQILDT